MFVTFTPSACGRLVGLIAFGSAFLPSQSSADPPRLVLETTQVSGAVAQSDAAWAGNVCGGKDTFHGGARYEWTPVYSAAGQYGSVEALSGWALNSHQSTDDVPFTHPFGKFDYEYQVLPDTQYSALLAPHNTDDDQERVPARAQAITLGLLPSSAGSPQAPVGFMAVEQDMGLVPEAYRPNNGDRVAVFGRWIIDCGHNNWQSEIHPPTVTVVGRSEPAARLTHVDIVANPYLVSQEFAHGGIYGQLVHEVGLAVNPLFPLTAQMTADAGVLPPTNGLMFFSFKVKPPAAGSPLDRLYVRLHVDGRNGVVFQPFQVDDETIEVIGVLSEDLTPAPVPANHKYDVTADQLNVLSPDIGAVYKALIGSEVAYLGNPWAAVVLNKGIEASLYDSPVPPDLSTGPVIQGFASAAPWGQNPVSFDDTQAFPLIGWVEVSWVRTRSPRPFGTVYADPKMVNQKIAEILAATRAEGPDVAARMRDVKDLLDTVSPKIRPKAN